MGMVVEGIEPKYTVQNSQRTNKNLKITLPTFNHAEQVSFNSQVCVRVHACMCFTRERKTKSESHATKPYSTRMMHLKPAMIFLHSNKIYIVTNFSLF